MQKGSEKDYNTLYDAILCLKTREECNALFGRSLYDFRAQRCGAAVESSWNAL